jgi:hypothetical protein
MSDKDNNSSFKNLPSRLTEFVVKGVLAAVMLPYMIWLRTAKSLNKEVYDAHPWLLVPAIVLALSVTVSGAFFGLPSAGFWAPLVSLIAGVLAYSHGFPAIYLLILRPLYRSWHRVLAFLARSIARLLTWIENHAGDVLRAIARLVVRLWRWTCTIWAAILPSARAVWHWLSVNLDGVWESLTSMAKLLRQQLPIWAKSMWAKLSVMLDSVSRWGRETWAGLSKYIDALTGSSKN